MLATKPSQGQPSFVLGIAEQSDARLKALYPEAASLLEKLVRDALELVETQNGNLQPERLPLDFFPAFAREFGSEPFERVPHGDFEKCEAL